jgi:hypothetical protein
MLISCFAAALACANLGDLGRSRDLAALPPELRPGFLARGPLATTTRES